MARWTWREIVVSRRRCRRCRRLSLVEKSIQLHETRTRECKRDGKHGCTWVQARKEHNKKKKKSFYLTRFVCVRVRLQLCACCWMCACVCVRRNYVVRQKLQSFCCVAACGGIRQRAPTPLSLSRRDYIANAVVARLYKCVCVCIGVWSRSSATNMTA